MGNPAKSNAAAVPHMGKRQLAALPGISARSTSSAPQCAPGSLVQIVPRRLRNGGERSSPHAPTQRSANPARPPYRSLPGPIEPTFPIRQASSGSSARRLPRIWGKPARRAAWSHETNVSHLASPIRQFTRRLFRISGKTARRVFLSCVLYFTYSEYVSRIIFAIASASA